MVRISRSGIQVPNVWTAKIQSLVQMDNQYQEERRNVFSGSCSIPMASYLRNFTVAPLWSGFLSAMSKSKAANRRSFDYSPLETSLFLVGQTSVSGVSDSIQIYAHFLAYLTNQSKEVGEPRTEDYWNFELLLAKTIAEWTSLDNLHYLINHSANHVMHENSRSITENNTEASGITDDSETDNDLLETMEWRIYGGATMVITCIIKVNKPTKRLNHLACFIANFRGKWAVIWHFWKKHDLPWWT